MEYDIDIVTTVPITLAYHVYADVYHHDDHHINQYMHYITCMFCTTIISKKISTMVLPTVLSTRLGLSQGLGKVTFRSGTCGVNRLCSPHFLEMCLYLKIA